MSNMFRYEQKFLTLVQINNQIIQIDKISDVQLTQNIKGNVFLTIYFAGQPHRNIILEGKTALAVWEYIKPMSYRLEVEDLKIGDCVTPTEDLIFNEKKVVRNSERGKIVSITPDGEFSVLWGQDTYKCPRKLLSYAV